MSILVLVGGSGVGKTTVGKELSKRTGLPRCSVDDYWSGWNGVYQQIKRDHSLIVECCRVPGRLVVEARAIVALTCAEGLRSSRLRRRGESGETVEERTMAPPSIAWPDAPFTPDLELSTDQPAVEVARQIIAALPWIS